ncbi:MAG: uracil phosphoribosyltransferase [Rikenellaceae bacterium]
MVNVLNSENTLLNSFMAELRDVNIQKDSMRFRRNLERVGEIMAYEISKTLDYKATLVDTPLGQASIMMPDKDIVLATILRAGIPFHQGFLNYYDGAQNAFISAFRKYSKDGTFNIKVEYISTCDLNGKTLILIDPMLASGASLVLTYRALVEAAGRPKYLHVAAAIASEEGINYAKKELHGTNTTIWCAAVDSELTVKSYIVPGLGDAGDLAYGSKL